MLSVLISWLILNGFLLVGARDTSTDCDLRGFTGATLNKCGYCVDGSTGLPSDYGVDCAGTCGRAFLDCSGACNGEAFVDECTGKCIDKNEEHVIHNVADDSQDNATRQHRDCRRLCRHDRSENDSNDTSYEPDECGVCTVRTTENDDDDRPEHSSRAGGVLQMLTAAFNKSDSDSSRYMDCSGTCYTPATVGFMATVSSETCNHCVGPNISTIAAIVDKCGRCLPNDIPCPCALREQDLCGVCNGSNDTCTTILNASPSVIPSDTKTVVTASGVTLKSKYHSVCVLVRKDVQEDGKDEEKFPAEVQGTAVTCTVNAPEGLYNLHLGVTLENGEVLSLSNTSIPIVVYSNKASITDMSPSLLAISKHERKFNVTFAATSLRDIKTIYCTIYGDGYDKLVVVTTKNISEEQATCRLSFPVRSTVASVYVSFDGVRSVAGPFYLKFFTQAPAIQTFIPLPEGDMVLVFFDTDVAIEKLTNCTDLFTPETMQTLGDGAKCSWVTKRQLLVTFDSTPPNNGGGAANDAVILKFKDGHILADNEQYTEAAKDLSVAFSLADEPPLAILVGPNRVPPCGDFILDGHQSTGLQRRRVRFTWDVTTALNGTDVKKSLQDLVSDATVLNNASLVVQSEDLEYDIVHTFELTVSNGKTATSTAKLELTRSTTDVPAVFIEPSYVHYNDRVPVDTQFTLHAHLDTPTCLRELYSIHFRWSTPNPKVKFDVLQMNSTSYTVEPYTLPPNENVTFYVDVWLNNNPNISSLASVSFAVAPSAVKAQLTGGVERSVGVASDALVLNASRSCHVVLPHLPLVYRWECIEEDMNPCYNYNPSIKDSLLIPQPVTRSSILTIPTKQFRPNSRLAISVRALSPTNVSEVSEAQSVVIHVINGSAPMVTIESIVSQDSSTKRLEVFDGLHRIPADMNVEIVANIESASHITSVKWNIPGFTKDLQPYSMTERSDNRRTRATLVIQKDYVIANGMYDINVTVTDHDGQSAWAMSHFTIVPPVTNCKVIVPDYEAFKMTYVYVESCTTAHQNYPLRYQVFANYKDHPMSLMGPTYHLPMAIMGPPVLPSGNISSNNTFSVQVCNVQDSCWWFNSSGVKVLPTRDMQAAAEHAFAMANTGKLTHNYIACLRRHAFYLMAATAVSPDRKQHSEIEFESQVAQAFLCGRKAVEEQCVDPACFANLFSFLTAIPIDSKTSREFMLTEVMDRALERIESQNWTLSAIGVQEVFLVLEGVYRFNASDLDMARKVASFEDRFQRILARSLQIGESPLLLDVEGNPVVFMRYNNLNSSLEVVTNATANFSVSVEFSNALKEKYNSWQCKPDGSLCRDVVSEMHFYPDHLYRPVEVDDENTVSDVVRVALFNPITGEHLPASTTKGNAVNVKMSVAKDRMIEKLAYNCYHWNTEDSEWSMDGVETVDNGGYQMHCLSEHVSTFAVIGRKPSLSPWIIVAIVVSVLVVLAVLAGTAYYFYRKSRSKSMRVSISKGYHANAQ